MAACRGALLVRAPGEGLEGGPRREGAARAALVRREPRGPGGAPVREGGCKVNR